MGYIHSVEYNPDGKLIATASGFGVHLWDASTGQRLRTLKDRTRIDKPFYGGVSPVGTSPDSSSRATISPDGRRIARGFGKIVIWDMQ